jgi:alkylation response protein AidB-like acyl-CoA dehydrogenase
MNFDLTPEQEQLRDTASSFARQKSPPARLRKLRDDPRGYSKELWKQMGDLGWLGVLFSEEQGGFGGAFVDAALILEEIGATLLPEPFVASVILGGIALSKAGSEAQRERWLAPLIAGDVTLALAYAEAQSRFDVLHVRSRAEKQGSGFVLSGQKTFVLNGHAADAIIVSARSSGSESERAGISLFLVPANTPGLRISPLQTMDSHKAALLTFDKVELGADALLGSEGGAADLLETLMDYGAAAACAEAVGVMRTMLQMTVEYLGTREQFGVKIGSFQALQHRAVDMFVEAELAKSASLLAALRIESEDALLRQESISAAKAQIATSGRLVSQQAIQLHGGIGITDEHDIGLYFKRMHVLNTLFGDEDFHTARYASLPSFTAKL